MFPSGFTLFVVFTPLLVVLFSLLVFQAKTGVPPVPSSRREVGDVITLLQAEVLPEAANIYELGAGIGTLALGLARAFPKARVIGIEISPLPCVIAKLRALGVPNLSIVWGDYRDVDLGKADVCTAYLMIGAAARLAPVLDRKLTSGAIVIASMFWFRERVPAITRGQAALYRWPAGRSDTLPP